MFLRGAWRNWFLMLHSLCANKTHTKVQCGVQCTGSNCVSAHLRWPCTSKLSCEHFSLSCLWCIWAGREVHTSPVYVLAQARWLQQAREGRFDNEDDYDDEASAFSSSADQGPPGQHYTSLPQNHLLVFNTLARVTPFTLSRQIFPPSLQQPSVAFDSRAVLCSLTWYPCTNA